jgi:WD40 repeat protein/DNA-binding SARP family transcriptional activator
MTRVSTPRSGVPRKEGEAYRRPVRFAVLGPLEVSGEEGSIPLGGPKQRIVLAHLVLSANQVVPTDYLIDALWGEELPEDPRSTLQTYVSRLRSTIGGDAIEGRTPGYVLWADRDEVDALRFEDLLGEARDGSEPRATDGVLTEALGLWRGPALADLVAAPSLSGEIARLEELRLQAIEEKIGAELELGHHAQVIPELETLTRSYALRERLSGELMLAQYRCGRQAEALSAFERARTVLAEELGIDPSADLRRLHEQILRQDPRLDLEGEPLRGYRLLEQVGEGAFGIVYRATQPQIGREVAIKAVPPELANHPDFVRRFEREAQIVARLEHPHIVPLYDYWREPDAAYLVMRFLRGGSVEQLLLEKEPIEPERAASILDQVAAALSAAHRQGVVHRDVKPGNVLLDEEGNAYLTDFGVALDVGSPERSSGTMIRGTPEYLSPEQVRLDPVSPRTDVYALGIVAYEMLTGVHPFPETSLTALFDHHLRDPIPAVRDLRPAIPAAVDRAIGRATAKDADDRYPDALEFAAAFRAAVQGAAIVAEPVGEIRNPYKGLRAFLEADAADFFGRELLTQRVVRRMEEDHDGARFLAVVGPSGSGKSSVVRAGVVPALRRGALAGSERWYVIDLVPGPHPLRELESALLGLAVEPPPSLLDMLEGDALGLVRAAERILPDPDAELLIVLDQMEEIFTLIQDEDERLHVLESVRSAAMAADSRVRVIATLRADFFDQPLSVRGFGEMLAQRTEAITPMSPEELERAIVAPADRAGLGVEPRLLAAMIADVVDRPGALPLLQYTLTELAERRDDGTLTLSGYRRIGGVPGALARRAEQIFGGMNEQAHDACRQLFLRLVTLGEGGEDTRRRVRRSELLPLADERTVQTVIDAFGRHRLLSFDRDPATREPTVEIAHEALLGVWDRLRGWIDEARDDIRTQRRLAIAVAEWEAAERDPSFLLGGSRLEQVQAWTGTTTLVLSDVDRAYVEESTVVQRAVRERERALERRSIRRLRSLVAVGLVAALVATTLTVIAVTQRGRAVDEARISQARALSAAAVANLETDPELSILLATEAVDRTRSVDGSVLPEAEEALHRAVVASRVVKTIPGIGGLLAWSPKGVFVTEGLEGAGVIDIRDDETGETVLSFQGHEGDINDVAFSPDGSKLATAGDDGQLKIWDPTTGALLSRVSAGGEVWGPSFSADGSLVAGAWVQRRSQGATVRVLDLTSNGDVVSEFRVPGAIDTAVSPDGERIAVMSFWDIEGGGVYDLETGEQAFRLRAFNCCTFPDSRGVAWSPDGGTIATTNADTVRLWDASTGRLRSTLLGHTGPVFGVAWSSDSTRLVSGGSDGTARVWDVDSKEAAELMALSAQETQGGIVGVAFSRDGTRVMAGDAGITAVKVWDVGPDGDAEWANIAWARWGWMVEFTPDGRGVVLAAQRSVSIWDPHTGRRLRTLEPATDGFWISSLDVSPDGGSIVLGGGDGSNNGFGGEATRSWNIRTGEELYSVEHDLDVLDVAFSPDGGHVVAGGWDGAAKIVDRSGRVVRVLNEDDTFTIHSVRFSPNGRLIAVAAAFGRGDPGTGRVKIWDWEQGALVRTIDRDAQRIAFDPSGSRIAMVSSEGLAEIWDVDTGMRVAEFAGRSGGLNALDYSPDGSLIATAGLDGMVRLFDSRTGSQRLVLRGSGCSADDVAFSPDGSTLASTTCGGVRIWALDIDDLLEIAGRNVTRTLTDEECRQYLHVDRCDEG